VFAREYNGLLGLFGGLELVQALLEVYPGFFDGLHVGFEALFDDVDVGLDPKEDGAVAGGVEQFADFFALFVSVEAAFDEEVLLTFGDLGDDGEKSFAIDVGDGLKIEKWGFELATKFGGKLGFAAHGDAKDQNSKRF